MLGSGWKLAMDSDSDSERNVLLRVIRIELGWESALRISKIARALLRFSSVCFFVRAILNNSESL